MIVCFVMEFLNIVYVFYFVFGEVELFEIGVDVCFVFLDNLLRIML